jgi:hypothetical protein
VAVDGSYDRESLGSLTDDSNLRIVEHNSGRRATGL